MNGLKCMNILSCTTGSKGNLSVSSIYFVTFFLVFEFLAPFAISSTNELCLVGSLYHSCVPIGGESPYASANENKLCLEGSVNESAFLCC
ncbi:hypothetical protein Hanom_Chr12g01125311 [Helianthus anomalus]